MGFLDQETKRDAEGRYVRFTDGEARSFKLLSIEKKTDSFMGGETRTYHEITAQDPETGDEKIIKANKSMLKGLAAIDDKIGPGTVVTFLPTADSFENSKGETIDFFSFKVSLEPNEVSPDDF